MRQATERDGASCLSPSDGAIQLRGSPGGRATGIGGRQQRLDPFLHYHLEAIRPD
ncbi:MAG: hypothetical protein M3014_13170 [Chloroflexota bacterium]|nr:hypothetical protein [Chloroflexota bacterium]